MRSVSDDEADKKKMRVTHSAGLLHDAETQVVDTERGSDMLGAAYFRRNSAGAQLQEPEDLAVELHSRISVLRGDFPPPLDVIQSLTLKSKLRNLFGIRDLLSIKKQWKQVVAAFLIGSATVYTDCVAQVYLELNTPKAVSKLILNDRGFDLIPHWHAPHAADSALSGFITVTALRFMVFTGPYAMRWTIARRWLVCVGLLFLLRGMCIICTVLPNPDLDCKSDVTAKDHESIFLLALGIALGFRTTCADVLYSGHTINFALAALIWYDYSRLCPIWPEKKWGWFERVPVSRIFAITWAVTGCIIIVATRFHYTVDVWIGFWMTYFLWRYYHEAIKVSPFHQGILMRYLTWQEEHATDLRYWRIRVANQIAYDEDLKKSSWKLITSEFSLTAGLREEEWKSYCAPTTEEIGY